MACRGRPWTLVFSCDNLSITSSWLIVAKFYNKVKNHKRNFGIDFEGYGPTVLELRAKRGLNKNFMECNYITQTQT